MPGILALSTLMAMCSSSWAMIWMALEINTLALCTLVSENTSKSFKNNNPTFLYLCVQIMTSAIIIISLFQETMNSTIMMTIAVLMKMGGWPLHTWYLNLITKMNLKQYTLILIMTWQKIIPLVMISSMVFYNPKSLWIFSLAIMSVLVPLVSLHSNLSMKSFLAISSVNNNGWLLMNTLCSMKILMLFLFLYSFSLKMMFIIVNKMKKKNIFKPWVTTIMVLTIANMSGLPPLTMFWAKLMVLKTLLHSHIFIIAALVMILCACYLLYFYLWMTNNEMVFSPMKTQNTHKPSISFKGQLMFMICLSTISFFITLDFT